MTRNIFQNSSTRIHVLYVLNFLFPLVYLTVQYDRIDVSKESVNCIVPVESSFHSLRSLTVQTSHTSGTC